MPSKPSPDRFINYQEVAEMIGVDVETLRKGKCQTNEIPRIRLSYRKVVFSLNAVMAWMAQKAHEAKQAKTRSQSAVTELLGEINRKGQRQAVQKTLLTIINGGKYR